MCIYKGYVADGMYTVGFLILNTFVCLDFLNLSPHSSFVLQYGCKFELNILEFWIFERKKSFCPV